MARGSSIATGFDYRLAAGSLLAFLGLALPFVPFPGDRIAPIAVEFRRAAMVEPTSFTGQTSGTICHMLAATMAFEDAASGHYARIDCGHDGIDVALGPKKLVGAGGIEPPTPTMSR